MGADDLSVVRRRLSRASRYELVALIARGGMASVYVGRLAGAAGFSRLVAIKRAHEHIAADQTTREMIVEEARLASKLHHPNVVAVQDVEQLEDELLLVMQYVEGASLSKLIMGANEAGGPLAAPVTLRILLDVCAGLSAAHELTDELGQPLPLVHRDVSPQNVLVGVDGMARLTDFGIAKRLEGAPSATHSGTLRGKVAYMAPEYIEGKRINARADQFALGAMAWEALANERLFQGANEAQTLRNVLDRDSPPLHEVVPGLPAELDAVVQRALRKRPEDRHPTVRAFAGDLERVAREAGLVADSASVAGEVRMLLGQLLDRRRETLRQRFGEDPPTEVVEQEPLQSGTVIAPDAARGGPVRTSDGPGDTAILEESEASTLARSAVSAHGASPRPLVAGQARRWPWVALAIALGTVVALAGVWVLQPSYGEQAPAGADSTDYAPAAEQQTSATPPGPNDGEGGLLVEDPQNSKPETVETASPAAPTQSAQSDIRNPSKRREQPAPAPPTMSPRPPPTREGPSFAPNPY